MLLKLYNIYKYESIYGIKFLLFKKFWSIKLKFYKLLNLKIVNSYYGIKLKLITMMYLNFMLLAGMETNTGNCLSSQKNPFIFLDVGANQVYILFVQQEIKIVLLVFLNLFQKHLYTQ